MTADALMVVRFVFTQIWRFFNSWYFPGTNVTPAGMAFFVLASTLIIKIVKVYLLEGDSGGGKSGKNGG